MINILVSSFILLYMHTPTTIIEEKKKKKKTRTENVEVQRTGLCTHTRIENHGRLRMLALRPPIAEKRRTRDINPPRAGDTGSSICVLGGLNDDNDDVRVVGDTVYCFSGS